MSLKKSSRPRLTADGHKLGRGKSFPRVVKPALKRERYTDAEQIIELRGRLADLEQRVQALARRFSVLEKRGA
jgi:hypothetical protein